LGLKVADDLAPFGIGEMDGDIVLWHGLDADAIAGIHPQAIDADVLDVVVVLVVGITAGYAGLIDEIAAVAAIDAE
jgi:hypothetical protein